MPSSTRTCPGARRCREEVALANGAVTALEELEEVPVPFGVTGPVLAEAGRRFEHRRKATWERLQWSAGLAAAAALILVVILNVGGEDERPTTLADSNATGATAGAAAPEAGDAERFVAAFDGLERQHGVNYDEDGDPRRGARHSKAALKRARTVAAATDAALNFASPDRALTVRRAERSTDQGRSRPPSCGSSKRSSTGTPAYIAAFAESPGADQPPDRILIWVAATDDCRFLSGASQPL